MHSMGCHFQHCKNFWVRTTQKNVVKDDPKILGTDAPNPNFLGQKIWVTATQKIWVDATQKIWVAATQKIWVAMTQMPLGRHDPNYFLVVAIY